jgi:transcription antitermination factor NusG
MSGQAIQFDEAMASGRVALAESGAAWYAVQTRARHEKRIGEELQKRGVCVFVPTMRAAHRWSDRTKMVEVPIFSCYVFVKVVASSAQRLEVLKTVGVFRFVSQKGEPAPIPDSEIESLRTVMANKLPVTARGFLKIGQKVRIRGGALDGVEGVLTESNGARKLVISVDLLQQSVEVTVEGYAVEPV